MAKNKKANNKNHDADADVLSSDVESDTEPQNTTNNAYTGKQNRNEKKARKLLSKLNFKPITGISKIIIKKSKQTFFVIQTADVYKSPSSDTFIIFGEAKIEDAHSQAQSEAAQLFTQMAYKSQSMEQENSLLDNDTKDIQDITLVPKSQDEPQKVEPINPSVKISEDDINLVMSQVDCTAEEARRGLMATNGDIVDAIIKLTK